MAVIKGGSASCAGLPKLRTEVNASILERLGSLAQVEILSNVDWTDILQMPCLCASDLLSHTAPFSDLAAHKAAEYYPGIYAVLVVNHAANRRHAGHDNSLWSSICDEFGLSGHQRAGAAFSMAVDKLRKSTNSPLVSISSTSSHPHVMLANVHTAVPAYAVKDLWNCCKQSEDEAALVEVLRSHGAIKEPLRHFAENVSNSEYLKYILRQLFYGKSKGLFAQEGPQGASLYTNIVLYSLNLPPHMTAELSELDIIQRSSRGAPAASILDGNPGRVDFRPSPVWDDNFDTHKWTLVNDRDGVEVTGFPMSVLPTLFNLDGSRARAVTREDRDRGLYVLLEDAKWRIKTGCAYPLPWSRSAQAALHEYTLYRTRPGEDPVVWAIGDQREEPFPFITQFSESETGTYKHASGAKLPPEVVLQGKELPIYTKSPVLLAAKAELRVVGHATKKARELRKGDSVFAEALKLLHPLMYAREEGFQELDLPIRVFAHRVDGIRDYGRGALIENLELCSPEHCAQVVGIPFVGDNMQTEKSAMKLVFQDRCIEVRARSRGDRSLRVPLSDLGLSGSSAIKIKLARAHWSVELPEEPGTVSRHVGGSEVTRFGWGSSFGWLNVDTAGWPARLRALVETANGSRLSTALTSDWSVNPSYYLGDWSCLNKSLRLDIGPVGPASARSLQIELEYYFPHLGSCQVKTLFVLAKGSSK